MPHKHHEIHTRLKRRRKKRGWWKYILPGASLIGKSALTTTFPVVAGVGLTLGYLIGNIEPMSPEERRLAGDASVIQTGMASAKEENADDSAPGFVDKVTASISGMKGVKWNVQQDGRIKVVIPYKRESIEEPENYEHGENEFTITPGANGEMAIEQKTKRNMAIYGYNEEKGTGKIIIREEGVVIKMRNREALLRVPNIMKKLKGGDWQNFEVEWKGTPGARNFDYQTVTTDANGNVMIRDVAPGAKTNPSGAIRPNMRMNRSYE